ncbi:unnamed protein product [Schistocephalus solidus]|uniref:PH_RBD domain-containing protein n=1 Tax=Schistocephalus solidus TaxID=70667 RepID=A0A183T2P3_SCHSO|nr:unnamed protein product [Schistocephalus solidus]
MITRTNSAWFLPVATPRATGGLNQVRVTGVACASTPGTSALFPLHFLSLPSSLSPTPHPPSCPSPCPGPHYPVSTFLFLPPSPPLTLPSSSTVDKVLRQWRQQSLRAPPDPNKHLLLPPDVVEGHLGAPRSRHWRLLDYFPVRRHGQQDVLVTKAMPHADGWMDHCLVTSKKRPRLQPRRSPRAVYGPLVEGAAPLPSADVTNLLTEKLQILKRWVEHFQSVPQDFKDATIVHLYKKKGNRQLFDYHREIAMPNMAAKNYARFLLNRLDGHLEQVLHPESQFVF